MEGANVWFFGVDAADGGLGLSQYVVRPETYGYIVEVADDVEHRLDWQEHARAAFTARLQSYGKRLHGPIQIHRIADWKYRGGTDRLRTTGFSVYARVIDLSRTRGGVC